MEISLADSKRDNAATLRGANGSKIAKRGTEAAAKTYRALDEAEENLIRLGLDEQSRDQANPQVDNDTVFIPVTASHADSSQLLVDDTVSGKASAYSRKSRKTIQHAAASQAHHPLVGGVASLLRNVNYTSGGTEANLYKIDPPATRSYERTKLSAPPAMYPTVNKPIQHDPNFESSEPSDEESNETLSAEYQRQSESYLRSIRTRKIEDVQAMKERHVRHHRLKAEQMRSRNEISGKRDLEALILEAKRENDSDKREAVDKRIASVEKNWNRHLKGALSCFVRNKASKLAHIQLDRNAAIASENRQKHNEEFKSVRAIRSAQEQRKAQSIRESRYAFCSEITRGILRLVEKIVDQSTQTMRDGTIQYRRATFAPTEWASMKKQELSLSHAPRQNESTTPQHNKSVELAPQLVEWEKMSDNIPNVPPFPTGFNSEEFATYLAQKDIDHLNEEIENLIASRKKLEGRMPFAGKPQVVFVRGDPILSGTGLLEVHARACLAISPDAGYVVLTPQVLMHILFQRNRDALNRELTELSAQREALLLEAAKASPPKPKAKEPRTKDQMPPNLVNRLNDIQLRINSLEADCEQLLAKTKAQASNLSDTTLGDALGRLIKERLSPVYTDDGDLLTAEKIPLTADLLCGHTLLQHAMLLCVGFPSTATFFASIKNRTGDYTGFATAWITLDRQTYLRRLSERELFWEPRKTPGRSEQHQRISHPLFSPIDLATPLMGSPFLDAKDNELKFVRTMSWRDECSDNELQWLNELSMSEECGSECFSEHCEAVANVHIDQGVNERIVAGVQIRAKSPGTAWREELPETFDLVSDRLCRLICNETSSRSFRVGEKGGNEDFDNITNTSASGLLELRAHIISIRRSFFESAKQLQFFSEELFSRIKLSELEYQMSSKVTDMNSFEWLHACDDHRRKDLESVSKLANALRAAVLDKKLSSEKSFATIVSIIESRCRDQEAAQYILAKLKKSVLVGPFAAVENATQHMEESAAVGVKRLFERNTESGSFPAPHTAQEMLQLCHPTMGKRTPHGLLENGATPIQAYFLHMLIEATIPDTVSGRGYERFVALCRPLPSICPNYAPEALRELRDRPYGRLPFGRAILYSAVVAGRVGSLDGIPFANSLDIAKLAASIAKRTSWDLETFVACDWWFDKSIAENLYFEFVFDGRLVLHNVLQFICANPSQHPSTTMLSWVNAISLCAGRGPATEISLDFREIYNYFHSSVFDIRKLELLESLQSPNFATGKCFNTRNLLCTSFGGAILTSANFQPSKI